MEQLRSDLRVRLLWGDTPIFGPGVRDLLLEIRKCGSVRKACEAMALSYSKGHRMVRKLEQMTGIPMVLRNKGGPKGGGAHLTEAGERFLRRYMRYEQELKRYAEEHFAECFAQEGEREQI